MYKGMEMCVYIYIYIEMHKKEDICIPVVDNSANDMKHVCKPTWSSSEDGHLGASIIWVAAGPTRTTSEDEQTWESKTIT